MASLMSPKFTAETLKLAAKQSHRCHVVSDRLRQAIEKYLKDQEFVNMKRKVLRLSQSFEGIKESNLLLPSTTSKELVDDPLKSMGLAKRWKVSTAYGDAGLRYQEDQAIAYVAARMPAVYSALYRVLSEVKRRVPDFSPDKVLDFGAGTGSAMWAMMEVWPGFLKHVNLVEPSQSMQRAGLGLIQDADFKDLPRIESYDSLQSLSTRISRNKSGRKHDLVIASYVLGEVPSLKDRITLVRQLWDLTDDILVLAEPGTPQGSKIISQMRSHILWMEKRKARKLQNSAQKNSLTLMKQNTGAFIVAPCPHDGPCPLVNTGKYCHFVQRLERTPSQRIYKRSKGRGALRGFEDEKFSYVAFRRGTRPRESWPLDGMKFETLEEMKANRIPENLDINEKTEFDSEEAQSDDEYEEDADNRTSSEVNISEETNASVENENAADEDQDDGEDEEEEPRADLGSGWGRIIYMPLRRGNRVEMDICRSTNSEGTEGSFDRVVVTQRRNPKLHHQAKRSIWGDLWPLRNTKDPKYFL